MKIQGNSLKGAEMYKLLVGGEVKKTTNSWSELIQLFRKYRKETNLPVTMAKESEEENG